MHVPSLEYTCGTASIAHHWGRIPDCGKILDQPQMTIAYFDEVMRQRFILKKVVDIQFRTSLLSRKEESSNNLQVSWLITTYTAR